MAKKKAVKKTAKPAEEKVDYGYLVAQLTEDRNAVCRLANQLQSDINTVNQRIDRIVDAINKSKSIKGLQEKENG